MLNITNILRNSNSDLSEKFQFNSKVCTRTEFTVPIKINVAADAKTANFDRILEEQGVRRVADALHYEWGK